MEGGMVFDQYPLIWGLMDHGFCLHQLTFGQVWEISIQMALLQEPGVGESLKRMADAALFLGLTVCKERGWVMGRLSFFLSPSQLSYQVLMRNGIHPLTLMT